jgi:ABC-type nitrate/sulfonate/bicarbonate transport system permease component
VFAAKLEETELGLRQTSIKFRTGWAYGVSRHPSPVPAAWLSVTAPAEVADARATRRSGLVAEWYARAARGIEVFLALAALALCWQIIAGAVANPTLVPSPLAVARAWADLAGDELPRDTLASLVHLGLGYVLGVALGLFLAALSARFALFAAILDPLAELLRPIGAISWIPIAILMFGIGPGVPVFLIFYAALFPIFVNTLAGIRAVPDRLVQAALSLGASPRLVVTHVILPAALPLVLAGARLSLGVSWMAMVAAELTGSDSGLGWRIFWYQEFFAMDRVMAVILTIGVLGYILDGLLRALQARVTAWSPDQQADAQ